MITSSALMVTMGFVAFSPPDAAVVTGDSVHWSNESVRTHTVTALDGSWDSGRVRNGGEYEHRFTDAGVVPYHCTLHPAMVGEVRVADIVLEAPAEPAAPGRAFPLTGRSALAPGTPVAIEADSGTGFVAVTDTRVGEDGTFATSVRPSGSAAYRAVSGTAASDAVDVLVLDRDVAATARRDGRRLTVDVQVTPASAGATVVLQLRLRRRFGWWPVARAKLSAGSRARLVHRLRSAPAARVVLTLPDGATELARSAVLRTGSAVAGGRGPAGRP